ncbi:helix-turn-helix domain-containing protein [Collimonas sp.]|jgi:excisionase family DNA binding protein|uniref:helix-turn-helix domain-containing protein n=1 Tax=Collimonas sp. TaxID=1963772 RepID=UPI002BA93F94|nr:helix-turn-helix domain-containing protein [Collimonas sp.]HWW04754.1 helix-turn-helix domain-containing protein [Collimonas sp.]
MTAVKLNQSDVTTQEAARLLGISVTSVQQLVERGVLVAWKTQGGHRRIPREAIDALKAERSDLLVEKVKGSLSSNLSALIVEDNQLQRMIYEKEISSWNIPIELRFCENGYQALIEIARRKHDILLLDIVMDGIDGYEIVKAVLANPELRHIEIAVLTTLDKDDLDARGGLPDEVLFFQKPIVFEELRGFLRGCAARKARQSRLAAPAAASE